jgi:hypothetical protein
MHPLLDPRVEHDGAPPALTAERYAEENIAAMNDLKKLQQARLAQTQGGSSTATGTGTGTATGTGTPSQQGSSPAGTPQPQPQSQLQTQTGGASPNPTATGSPRPNLHLNPNPNPTTNATAPQVLGRPPARPPSILPTSLPEGMLELKDVRAILAMGEAQRQVLFLRVSLLPQLPKN